MYSKVGCCLSEYTISLMGGTVQFVIYLQYFLCSLKKRTSPAFPKIVAYTLHYWYSAYELKRKFKSREEL